MTYETFKSEKEAFLSNKPPNKEVMLEVFKMAKKFMQCINCKHDKDYARCYGSCKKKSGWEGEL